MAKNIPAILADLETDLLKNRLYEFPGQVKEQKKVIRELRNMFKDAEQELKMAEADLVTDIAAETNPNNGKPAYSNKEARDAELERRKSRCPNCQDAVKAAREVGYKLEEAQDELEKLQDEYKSYRYAVAMVTQELALYAGAEESENGADTRYTMTERGRKAADQLY